MKNKVYVVYHKEAALLSSSVLTPIQVGRAASEQIFNGMISDNTGNNIAHKNNQYCELTALYWAWKNDLDSKIIGLMHYRRLLDFECEFEFDKSEVYVSEFDIKDYTQAVDSFDYEQYDLVIPKRHRMGRSIHDNYIKSHHEQDLGLARDIISDIYPQYVSTFDSTLLEKDIFLANMFTMKRDLFEDYCSWLFTILERVETSIADRSFYNIYQSRFIGFLAERLFTVYVNYLLSQGNTSVRVKFVNIINLSKAKLYPISLPINFNLPSCVNVVFSSDNNYLAHTAAMLKSLVDYTNEYRKYNLFFLHSNVNWDRLDLLKSVVAGRNNVNLYAINVTNEFDDSYRSPTRSPSNATYNRFLIFKLLSELDRVLYIDVDMIVQGDLAEVFDIDMHDKLLAAVPDFIMTRTLTKKVVTKEGLDLYEYQRDELNLSDADIISYFNAGLILFNLKAMDLEKVSADLMDLAKSKKCLFRDQDILNSYFKGQCLRLPAKYNVFNSNLSEFTSVPFENWREAIDARDNPFIVHFASGNYKPWHKKSVLFGELYWQYIRRTPFYNEVLAGVAKTELNSKTSKFNFLRQKDRKKISRSLPELLRRYKLNFFIVISSPFIQEKKKIKLVNNPHAFFEDAKGTFTKLCGKLIGY